MAKRYILINLGCPKNLVDGEGMGQKLAEAGYIETDRVHKADAIIVNTCGFIASAKEESIKALLQLAAMKRPGQLLVAAGCLGERYAADLLRDMPDLDGILGTLRWSEIVHLLDQASARMISGEAPCWTGKSDGEMPWRRKVAAQGRASAYLKIADGCSVGCAFCAIPKIKGPHRSKPVEQILDEARQLAEHGVKELVLVAQNSTAYGHDWGQKDVLADLLERLSETVPGVPWIRLMYAFPADVTPQLMETMARTDNVVKYLDLPLQHADPGLLRAMRRPETHPAEVIRQLREAIPDIAIRSAFIVGYPGEGEREFDNLLRFVEETELDRVGVFTYSIEEGTFAASLPGRVSKRVAQERYRRVMALQQGISRRKNERFVGQTIDVLIEGVIPDDQQGRGGKRQEGSVRTGKRAFTMLVGRSYRDAPEVDGTVLVHGEARVGDIVPVRIVEAREYDLVGEIGR